jgi:PAB-dependent poly(A)-specific ribonuclease subunit 3
MTLDEYHSNNKVVPENVMWCYISQIASAIQAVHHAGLAARNIDRHKIILTGDNRIRLNEGSVIDVIQYDSNIPLNLQRYQVKKKRL